MKSRHSVVVLTLITLTLITLTIMTTALAEGDVYQVNEPGYPDRFWGLMSQDEIASYEANGWTRTTGELWMRSRQEEDKVIWAYDQPELPEISPEAIETLYAQGYGLFRFYNWTGFVPGKNGEQSVSVGYRLFGAEEAYAYLATGEIPPVSGEKTLGYEVVWTVDGQIANPPSNQFSAALLKLFHINLVMYDMYQVVETNGGVEVLRNGDIMSAPLLEVQETGMELTGTELKFQFQ